MGHPLPDDIVIARQLYEAQPVRYPIMYLLQFCNPVHHIEIGCISYFVEGQVSNPAPKLRLS